MERKLNIIDRLIIVNTLPTENNLMTLKIIKDLKAQLGITEKEHKEFELRQEGKAFKWNEKANEPKSFDIGDVANDIITNALKALEKQKKLTEEMIETYEMFVKET